MDALTQYREKRTLSQQALADALGVSRQMIGMIEGGRRKITAEFAVQINAKLGIPLARLRPDLWGRRAA